MLVLFHSSFPTGTSGALCDESHQQFWYKFYTKNHVEFLLAFLVCETHGHMSRMRYRRFHAYHDGFIEPLAF